MQHPVPESKVHGANMGPTWVLSAPDGPHVGPMNLAIRGLILLFGIFSSSYDNIIGLLLRDLTDDISTLVQVMAWSVRQQAIAWANVDPVLWWHKTYDVIRLWWACKRDRIRLHIVATFGDVAMIKVVKIVPIWRHGLFYITPWLMMTWRSMDPGHQQPWHYPSSHGKCDWPAAKSLIKFSTRWISSIVE